MISQFRGVGYDLTSFSTPKPVVSADAAFTKILAKIKLDDKKISLLELIKSNWPEIIQPISSEDCTPEKLCKKKILWLSVSNSIIKTKIQFAEQSIVKKINSIIGKNFVNSIKCKLK